MSVIKNTGIISAGTLASKIMGFLREVAIATVFGASRLTDAYLVAQVIPNMLFSIVGSSLSTTMIPLTTEYREKEGEKSAIDLANAVTNITLVITVVLSVVGMLLAPLLIKLVAPGFGDEARQLSVALSRIMFPIIIFLGMASIATGILQSQKRFIYPAFVGIPFNIIMIGSALWAGRKWGIAGLAWGTVLAVLAQWLFQVPDIRRSGYRYRLKMSHPGLKRIGQLIMPVVIGSGASQINILVDRILASGLVFGSIAALNFANRLIGLALGLFSGAVAGALYPELAVNAAEGDIDRFRTSLVTSLDGLLFLMLPMAVGIIVLREPLVRLAFERGAFDPRATSLTAYALMFFAVGLPAVALRDVVVRGFYALQDTITPMWIGLVTVVLNIAFNLVLIRYLALGGLALGSSLAGIVGFILLLYYLRKKLAYIRGKLLVIDGSKILVAALVMGCICFKLSGWMLHAYGDILTCLATVLTGAIVYFATCRILGLSVYYTAETRIKTLILKK